MTNAECPTPNLESLPYKCFKSFFLHFEFFNLPIYSKETQTKIHFSLLHSGCFEQNLKN